MRQNRCRLALLLVSRDSVERFNQLSSLQELFLKRENAHQDRELLSRYPQQLPPVRLCQIRGTASVCVTNTCVESAHRIEYSSRFRRFSPCGLRHICNAHHIPGVLTLSLPTLSKRKWIGLKSEISRDTWSPGHLVRCLLLTKNSLPPPLDGD
jgi:hypothetical protein